MVKLKDKPKGLRPYIQLGLGELSWSDGDTHATCLCPYCNDGEKFGVNLETSQYKCMKCGETGNSTEFIRWLWDMSEEGTQLAAYDELLNDRGYKYAETLQAWGVCQSMLTGQWLVPGYDWRRNLRTVYTYQKVENKRRLMPTSTMGHHMCGLNTFDESKSTIFLFEGAWDGMAAWEQFRTHKLEGDRRVECEFNDPDCLASDINVVSVPGTQVFFQEWCSLFSDKVVNLVYDNDKVKPVKSGTSVVMQSAGLEGMKRTAATLYNHPLPPKEINYLKWTNDMPTDIDWRDMHKEGKTVDLVS